MLASILHSSMVPVSQHSQNPWSLSDLVPEAQCIWDKVFPNNTQTLAGTGETNLLPGKVLIQYFIIQLIQFDI